MITPIPGPAGVITAGPLHAAGVTVTGVDIDELDTALTTGPWRGREAAQATARIEFTTAGTAERRQMPVRIGTRWPWPRSPVRRSGLPAS
jgi:hypothetical protein